MAETQSLPPITQTRAPFGAWVGVVLLFLLFGGIVLALVGPSPRRDDYEAGRATKRFENLKKLRADDHAALTNYAYVDKAKGTARIPIDRAMELTVAELAQKKPAAAYPIAPPAPAAAPAASPAPGNAGTTPAAPNVAPAPPSSKPVVSPSPGTTP